MILASYYIPLLSTYLARQTCKIESNIKQKTVPLTPPNLFIHFCRSFSIFHTQRDIYTKIKLFLRSTILLNKWY